MKNTLFYIIIFLIAYFGLKYWRMKRAIMKQQEAQKNNASQVNFRPKWDAEDIEYEEVKDSEK